MIGEKWKEVQSAPQFLVSSEGRIMVKPYWAPMPSGGKRPYGGEPYFGVWSKQNGRFIIVHKNKTYKVHQLVCEAFNGPRPKIDGRDAVCMHLDENAANNRPGNLMWGTQKENLNAPGYLDYRKSVRGDLNPSTKYSDETVGQIRALYERGVAQAIIAEVYGLSSGYVSDVVNLKTRHVEVRI